MLLREYDESLRKLSEKKEQENKLMHFPTEPPKNKYFNKRSEVSHKLEQVLLFSNYFRELQNKNETHKCVSRSKKGRRPTMAGRSKT